MTDTGLMPLAFLNHGGGPMPLIGQQPDCANMLKNYGANLELRPKAILMVTAHWVTNVVSVSSGESHPLLFDYGGFPPDTYKYKYDAPGSPELAESVCSLLSNANIPCNKDSKRGWDHGVFVPLMLAFPDASIPVVSMSLHSSLDPVTHLRIGEILAPLREQGILILGSGVSFHNFDYLFAQGSKRDIGVKHSITWNDYLVESMTSESISDDERLTRLKNWSKGPSALSCHPLRQEEHLIPLHVIAGAARGCKAHLLPKSDFSEFKVSSFEWK